MSTFPNIHILGIQGSGKGTQSALLVQKYGFTYLASGNQFRERAAISDDFGKRLTKELSTGHLFPNELLFRTVQEFLDNHPITAGLLGDGVIRTIDQYYGLQKIWTEHNLDDPLLIHLELTEDVALRRIEHRRQQQAEGNLEYHKVYSGKLLYRNDDHPEAIQKRFALFHSMTQPVIKEFESRERCIHINADQTVEEIHNEICAQLESWYPNVTHGAH